MSRNYLVIDPARILAWFRVLHPRFWIMLGRYDAAWDRRLRELMSANRFRIRTRYSATLGGAVIWIANAPYAAMTPRSWDGDLDDMPRPSRRTILLALDKLRADTVAAMETEPTP